MRNYELSKKNYDKSIFLVETETERKFNSFEMCQNFFERCVFQTNFCLDTKKSCRECFAYKK